MERGEANALLWRGGGTQGAQGCRGGVVRGGRGAWAREG